MYLSIYLCIFISMRLPVIIIYLINLFLKTQTDQKFPEDLKIFGIFLKTVNGNHFREFFTT